MANSTEETYDGKSHAATGFETLEFTVNGNKFTVSGLTTSDPSSINVITVANAISGTAVVKDANGNDVTAQFTVTKTDGTLEITAREVTVSVEDKTVSYTGEEQTGNTEYTFTNVVEGQTATITYTPSKGTLVDTYDNGAYTDGSFKVMAGEVDVTGNYTFGTQTKGKLIITDEDVPDGLVVTKTADDKEYKLGETVTFKITATNIYNEAKTIKLTEIEGVTLAKDTFENVEAGGKIETTATYKITEADIVKGSFKNTVTATIDQLSKKADAAVKTEKANPHLTVEKTTTSTAEAEDGKYALGEKITYKITVTNDGNLTITDVVVTDELTGDEWKIASLGVGDSKEFTAEYVVTEDDILAGKVVNEATATGDNPSDDPTEDEPGTKEDPTEDPKPHLTVEKEATSTPADGKAYKAREKVTYKITVTNDGNLTITNVKVSDELTGDTWTVDALKPGESKEFTAEYTVTKADALAGSVKNVATADGDNPTDDPTEKDPGEENVPTTEGDVIYWFSEGDGQTWWKDSGVPAYFTVSRDPFDEDAFGHFLGIEIDGVEVDKSMYTAVSGSVKLTISKDYMEKLALGEHIIVANFDDGTAQAKFNVASKDVPDTGDHAEPRLYASMLCLSLAGCLALLTGKRKKKEDER